MSRISALLKAVPLCCGLLFVAAAEDECTIRIVTDDGDGDDCEAVDEVCNLDCELAVNEEGCEICECAAEPPPPPPAECQSDADCLEGQYCESNGCPPCASDPNQPCDVACTFEGRCVDIQPDPCAAVLCSPDTFCAVDENGEAVCLPINGGDLCFSDEDCGERAFCDFSTCNADGTEPGDPDRPDDNGGGGQDIACLGTCKEFDEPIGCENVLCQEGTICVEGFNGPECVPVESQCNTDEDCAANGQGGRCELTCMPMPDCPECDACLVVGQCVQDEQCAALCGPGQECRINDDGSVSCEEVRPPECTSDADCASGSCNANEVCMSDPNCADPDGSGLVACDAVCWGYCVEPQPEPTSCFEDSECAADEICETVTTCVCNDQNDPQCLAPCYIEGRCVPANSDGGSGGGNEPGQP